MIDILSFGLTFFDYRIVYFTLRILMTLSCCIGCLTLIFHSLVIHSYGASVLTYAPQNADKKI